MQDVNLVQVLAGLLLVVGPFVGLWVWLRRYWGRRTVELRALATRLGGRFAAESTDLPQAAAGLAVPALGLGRLASNVIDGSYEGTDYSVFDLTVVYRKNTRTLYTMGCFRTRSDDDDRFVLARGGAWPAPGGYAPHPVPSSLADRGITLQAANDRLSAARIDAIVNHFETTSNPSRSADGRWLVEASDGRILLLYHHQVCPTARMEDFIRDGCAVARLGDAA